MILSRQTNNPTTIQRANNHLSIGVLCGDRSLISTHSDEQLDIHIDTWQWKLLLLKDLLLWRHLPHQYRNTCYYDNARPGTHTRRRIIGEYHTPQHFTHDSSAEHLGNRWIPLPLRIGRAQRNRTSRPVVWRILSN